MRPWSTSAFMANLFKSMPLRVKLAMIARNRARAFRGDGCCGHPGEPGC
jgi:hypothetical protein